MTDYSTSSASSEQPSTPDPGLPEKGPTDPPAIPIAPGASAGNQEHQSSLPKAGVEENSDPISRVQRLIEQGLKSEALKLLLETLTSNPANSLGLYLYAQVAPDRTSAIYALTNALQIQPSFFEARLLLNRLQAVSGTPAQEAPPFSAPASYPASATTPSGDQNPLMQQMLMQHHMLMQQQMVNQQQMAQQQVLTQQQLAQQQMLNQQQLAQQQLMSQYPASSGVLVASQNGLAFWVGAIAAFFGFFGIAHMINGKIGTGIVYLLVGFVWDAIAVALAATVVGACVALPLHLIFCYYNAKNGARSTGLVTGTVVKL